MSILMNEVEYIYGKGTAFEKVALYNINLNIEDGEMIGLIGHTGSGKSTLIQHLNGLLVPTSGGVYYNGEDINDKDYSKKQLRGKVSIVFQYPEQQLFEKTVLDDVKFGPGNLGLEPLEVDMRSFEALRQVGISDDLLDVSPLELSGGQKRRVAIAGVLAMEPEVLILDEPTAGLDPAGRDDILNLIKQTFSLCENDIGYINLRRKVCITKPKIFWKPQIRRLCISFPMQGNLQENIILRIMMITKEKMRF